MITERDDRYNGSNDENRERRSYSGNRDGYNNNDRPYHNHSNGNRRPSYNNSRDGGYDNRSSQNRYDRPNRSYDNNQRSSYGDHSYENKRSYNSDYQNQGPLYSSGDSEPAKKRRPRVGENNPAQRNTGGYNDNRRPQGGGYGNQGGQGGYGNRDNRGGGYGNQGGYGNRDNRGGYNDNRRPQGGSYGNQGGYGNRDNRGGYNNQGGRPQGGGYGNRPQRRDNNYNPDSKYSVQKQLKYREENFDPNEPIRLNKYLANAGICSRREADEFIQAGVVKVNDVVVNELGTKVKRSDKVMFHDQPVKLEQKVYVLLNKPKNCVTTADDPQERLTVMDLVKTACHERIFPVGRLDRNTTGVLLLTNDGDLASKLTHPKFLKKKIYHVWLDKNVSIADMQKIAEGIELEDGEIHADAISYINDTDKDQIGIEIHSGRNRIVRRIFETLGYRVVKLDRVYFAGLTKKQLKRGQWRYLTDREVNMLRMGAFE